MSFLWCQPATYEVANRLNISFSNLYEKFSILSVMTVKEVYEKYWIPPNLQKHMLRVAAVAHILAENWKEKNLDKKSITYACLFHDMANIIKFDFTKPSIFKEEEGQKDHWKKIQSEVMEKYGPNIHEATLTIAKEVGCPSQVLDLIAKLEWDNTIQVIERRDFESAITIYSDMRIGPFGILPLQDRLSNLKTRNSTYDFDKLQSATNLLENTLQQHIMIQLNSITDTQINKRFEELLKLEV